MLKFNYVKYQNFLSSGSSAILIELDQHHLNLISGKNGAGKSTIGDALCFALYGKAYRNINKNQLINSINGKKMLVEVAFEVSKKKYRIVRGIKPNVFEIWENDVLLNQNPNIRDHQKLLESQILKMNYRAFTQVVIMGSGSYVPFMMLPCAQRREFIEDLLDIRIFSVMNTLLKEKVKLVNDTLVDLNNEIKLLKEKALLQQSFIEKQKKEQSQSILNITKDTQELEAQIQVTQAAIAKLMADIQQKNGEADDYDANDQLSELRATQKQLNASYDKALKDKEFYASLEHCPTCGQHVHDDHRETIVAVADSHLDTHRKEIEAIESSLVAVNKKLDRWQEISLEVIVMNKEVTKLNKQIDASNVLLVSNRERIQDLRDDTTSIDEEQQKLKEYARSIVGFDKQKKRLIEDRELQHTALTLLQDSGIKAKIIKQYIPVINKRVNHYLDKMDFFCQFMLDENFNESVKSRYRDDFSYNSFSEGQKLRIDLALIFTWRDIARMKNSVTCNLVLFDEIFDSSLDGSGMDLALSLLDDMKDSNIFVISHRDSNVDKYPNVITIDMRNNFSYVKE